MYDPEEASERLDRAEAMADELLASMRDDFARIRAALDRWETLQQSGQIDSISPMLAERLEVPPRQTA